MKISQTLKFLVLSLLLTVFVSCGSQAPMVDDVKVNVSNVDGDVVVSLTADLAMGNLMLPSVTFPIILPKTGKEVGIVSLSQSAAGLNQIGIDLNVSSGVHLETTAARLPNGALMPIILNQNVLTIPLGKVTVLLSLNSGAQALGIIIPISSFDNIGGKVGTTVLMPMFNKNGNLGAAGIYTSKVAGENGFALVTDISNKIPDIFGSALVAQQREEADVSEELLSPSRTEKRIIDKELLKMHKRKAVLKL